jgi:CxxC motif-containing protein
VLAICHALRSVRVSAPVAMGDIIASNVLGSGVDILATRDMPPAENISGLAGCRRPGE